LSGAISKDDFAYFLGQLPGRTAPGLDQMPYEMLRYSPESLRGAVLDGVNAILRKQAPPPASQAWLGGQIRFLFTGGRVTTSMRPATSPCAYRTACTSSCRRSSRIAYTSSQNGTACWTPHRRGSVGCTPRSARCSPCTGLSSKRQIRKSSCGSCILTLPTRSIPWTTKPYGGGS
jgi:hypothetical protein